MRVAFLIFSLNRGGAERATVNLANYLIGIGWEVVIYTLSGYQPPAYKLSKEVSLVSLNLNATSSTMLRGLINNIYRLVIIRRRIQSADIDCLIGMGGSANVLVGLACLGRKTVAIGSDRTHPVNKPVKMAWRLVQKFAYVNLNMLVCLTEETREWQESHTYARKTITIPNGMDYPLKDSEPVIQLDREESGKSYILGVGRLIQSKQFDELIDVFTNIAGINVAWDLIIVGDGPERHSLEQQIHRLGLDGRVHLVGAVGNLNYWYAQAEVFVSTSRHEGFPNSVLEALAYGLPVVAYDCKTGPSDLIEHGVNGYLLEVSNKFLLLNHINELLVDSTLRSLFAKNAKQARSEFSIEKIGSRWTEMLVDSLLR